VAREAIIQEDTVIKGKSVIAGRFEIRGYFEGELTAEEVNVHKGGTFYGTLKSDRADVAGSVQGEVFVKTSSTSAALARSTGRFAMGSLRWRWART